jgi:hypothetical protein
MTTKFYQNGEKTTNEWYTPIEIINSLGEFDLDPACPNNLNWKTAENFYSLSNGQDGLSLPWNGRIWLNPPYSNWGAFLKKLKDHNNGVALIFARTETKAFFDHVWNGADSILFLKGRVKFIKSDLSGSGSSTAPSVLIAYGENNTQALEKCGIEGKLVYLKDKPKYNIGVGSI